MIAAAVVHTTGINWAAVTAIGGPVTFILGGIIGFFARSISRKLDQIGKHLNRQDGALQQHGERLARIEGASSRLERARR